jgi:aspartate kinase
MEVNVFKFGGASVNSAAGVRNVAEILKKEGDRRLVVVVSAMGKTTNALEKVLRHYLEGDVLEMIDAFEALKRYHFSILSTLFGKREHPVTGVLESLFDQLRGTLRKGHLYDDKIKNHDFEYDRIVGFGELFSSAILFHWIVRSGIPASFLDAREVILTDRTYRDAKVDLERTGELIRERSGKIFRENPGYRVILTQGFIAGDPAGHTTTLGREGSDYSAALFAYALKSKEMTIWKDVPGVMNADPKWMKNAKKLDNLSYRETIELAWYGASVIHPKTIKPLENGNIILKVRSFRRPDQPGTVIRSMDHWKIPTPIFIRKTDQVLISISPRDFSFIVEENLSAIFRTLAKHRIRVNVMQNSAISFSICVDGADFSEAPHGASLQGVLSDLSQDYTVLYNTGLELITLRHYNARAIARVTKDRKILLEQKTRHTIHLVLS